jgi:hypothetical protein
MAFRRRPAKKRLDFANPPPNSALTGGRFRLKYLIGLRN